MVTKSEIIVPLRKESWELLYDLLKVRQYSLERDVARADETGSMDYAQILLDEAAKCKEISDLISFNITLNNLSEAFVD
jgi:hypothetical protein